MLKTKKILAGILCLSMVLSTSNVAQAKNLEDLLVEKGIISQGERSAVTGKSMDGAQVYYDEGTRIDFPDSSGFSLKVRTMLQARYTFADEDEDFARVDGRNPDVSYNGVNGTRVNTSGVDVVRARLIVEGTALYQKFAYKLEGDFVGTSNDGNFYRDLDGSSSPDVKDAYIMWQPCDGWGTQIGQFKTYASRTFRTNDAFLQFADRSIASEVNHLGWQQGIAQHGTSDDGSVQGSIALFNGTSSGEGRNMYAQDTNHAVSAALRINALGDMGDINKGTMSEGFFEGDLNNTQELALNMGTSYTYTEAHLDRMTAGASQYDMHFHHANADLNGKVQGFSLHGEYYFQRGESQHNNSVDFDLNGGYVQAGVFVEPNTLELAARYGIQDCDNGRGFGWCAGRDMINEAGATINYYEWNNSLKAQLGYSFINEDFVSPVGKNGETDANTSKWTFQVSSYF